LENPIAERINGIIKEEYLNNYIIYNLSEAKKLLEYAVSLYNNDRPHSSIGNMIPSTLHHSNTKTKRLWKNYYKQNPNIVNQYQDLNKNVNVIQDFNNKL
jgi:putative transposase